MSENPEYEIVTVASGAQSLRSCVNGETFHPVVGPMIEAYSLHVQQQRLVERAAEMPHRFVVWDVGLGAAANAIAVLAAFRGFHGPARVEMHSFDTTTSALIFALEHASALGYLAEYRPAIERLLSDGRTTEGPVSWHLHQGDFRALLDVAPAPHAVLYDPYSPQTNPELFTTEIFTALERRLDKTHGCLLSNYTRSTAVRVTLMLAGFFVGHGAATGEKDQTTLASNSLELIPEPLDSAWLRRVARSTRSAPFHAGGVSGPISPEELQRLSSHPQFH
jgi:tRNA U34 5-methylaminomethyl-2-thiouridine-forming methyltransferase MnmC